MMKYPNVLGLFSGGGGLDLGMASSGCNVILSSDLDPVSCQTLVVNQGKKDFLGKHPVLCEDVRKLNSKIIADCTKNKTIDLLIGGPPCQAFSVFGRRKGLGDPRGNLVFEYARILKDVSPEALVFENVAGLKTIHGGQLFEELVEVLSLDGQYNISTHEYEVANFGVPQFRRRIFFIGTKKMISVQEMTPTHFDTRLKNLNSLNPFNTVISALSHMPDPVTDWREDPALNAHVGRKHSSRIIDRYKSLKFGERDPKTRINKLDPNRPSFTIIVGSDAGGGKGHVHPYSPREVTPRESARIQTFPDWWEFCGTGRHVIRQVGNAVPPLFAAALGKHILKEVFDVSSSITFDGLVDSLGLEFLKNDHKRSVQSQDSFKFCKLG
ncbi:Modification methylase HaeIII [anaerobic digester metagenome]